MERIPCIAYVYMYLTLLFSHLHSDGIRAIVLTVCTMLISGTYYVILFVYFHYSTIDWSQVQYEKGGGLLLGRASERKSEPK